MNIVWKDTEFENYQVSSTGEICNKITGRILKKAISKTGYYIVVISRGARNTSKCLRVHREVAKAFLPNTSNKPCVNHIDGNKLNNDLSNLEWVNYPFIAFFKT